MVVLNIYLNNFCAFKNFRMNLTYPKKIVGSSIIDEHLAERPNFRYKKVNIIMGSNASGKTTFGRILMRIFNFLDKKNYELLTDMIGDQTKEASFTIDLASAYNLLYRVSCIVSPPEADGKYGAKNVKLEIRQENIRRTDSYESCVRRLEETPYVPETNYLSELEKMGNLDWLFEYPEDTQRTLRLPSKDKLFRSILESILKALDPAIEAVEESRDVDNAYVVHIHGKSIILQDGEPFNTSLLSSGTKAGVEVARVITALMQEQHSFFYCDEKFPYIHSDLEKAILSLMIDLLHPNDQLFVTTHNTDILDMNLPKHTFTFLKKDMSNPFCPITSVSASSLLKRSTDSLKNAVENDLFSIAPALDDIYAIADL